MSSSISLINLFETGTHRGNSRSSLNPTLKKRVYGYDKGLCVIDLVHTLDYLEKTKNFLFELGKKKKTILIVGTSKHLQSSIPSYSQGFNTTLEHMPYVNSRWLGGTLTNWSTIRKTLRTLEKLEKIEENDEFFKKLARNEQLRISKQKSKILNFFDGLRTLQKSKPSAVLIVDMITSPIAVKEAELKGLPVIGLVNTKAKVLPKDLSYTIVSNTGSENAVNLLLKELQNSYNEGVREGSKIQEIEAKNKFKDS